MGHWCLRGGGWTTPRALADPLPVWADGVCRWSDPPYVRLRLALRGIPVRRSGARRSAPCRVERVRVRVAESPAEPRSVTG